MSNKGLQSVSKASHLVSREDQQSLVHERLLALLDSIPLIIWSTDTEGRTQILNNRRWLSFIGLDEDHSQGMLWYDALHSEDQQQCIDAIRIAFKWHRPFAVEYRLRRHDDVYRWILDSGEPIHMPDGNFCGYVGCAIDITERKATEQQLKHSHDALTKTAQDIELLSELNEYLQICTATSEVTGVLSHYVQRLFPECAGAICMINESRSLVETLVVWGDTGIGKQVFTQDECWALRRGKLHHSQPQQNALNCAHVGSDIDQAYLCVPMIAHSDVQGMLHLRFAPADRETNEFASIAYNYRPLAVNFAETMALALANFKLREALKYQSIRDPLTQLYNRRYMLESLEREIRRAERSQSLVGVIMLDVDHFKRYNDSWGHHGGDAALQELAKFFRNTIRGADIVSRYGGEEFTIVLPDITAEDLLVHAEILRAGASQVPIMCRDQHLANITISLGLALFPQHGGNVEAVLQAADKALYQAKNAGRDRACMVEV